MEVSIYVDGVAVTPNPVTVKESFMISVSVKDKTKALAAPDGKLLTAAEGGIIVVNNGKE